MSYGEVYLYMYSYLECTMIKYNTFLHISIENILRTFNSHKFDTGTQELIPRYKRLNFFGDNLQKQLNMYVVHST
jgi:hypothetical protein